MHVAQRNGKHQPFKNPVDVQKIRCRRPKKRRAGKPQKAAGEVDSASPVGVQPAEVRGNIASAFSETPPGTELSMFSLP